MDRTAHTTIPNVSAIDILSFTSFPRVHSLLGKRFLNHKMRGVSTGCNNDPTQNFRNYLGWFLGAVHPIVGKVIGGDRKSIRLNSSHITISYAVFCLKKKKQVTAGPQHQGRTRAAA